MLGSDQLSFLPVQPQTTCMMSLSLSSHVSGMEMILAVTFTGFLRISDLMHLKVFRIVPGTKYDLLCYYLL